MILTDANYEIMTLLRSHRDDAKGLQIMARHPYPLHSIRLRTPLVAELLTAALTAADAPNKLRSAPPTVPGHARDYCWHIPHIGCAVIGMALIPEICTRRS